MRMSDWSSDVCSSDLIGVNRVIHGRSCHDAAELQSTIFVVKCGGIELQRAVCEDVLGAELEGIDRFRAETLADGENRRKRRNDPAGFVTPRIRCIEGIVRRNLEGQNRTEERRVGKECDMK